MPNYAFKPIAEQALGSNQTIVPQRLNAALDLMGSHEVHREHERRGPSRDRWRVTCHF